MIIICKECSTKFRLDESLLKETGSPVRCCVCKTIFSAYPPQVLGSTEAATQPAPTPQGYFDSEENVGLSAVPAPDSDDDGLELDVDEEEDDDLDADGLDLGDDDTGFDDGGINLGGSNMPGIDTDTDFDDDLGLSGDMPGMDFDYDSDDDLDEIDLDEIDLDEIDLDEIDLDTDINMNLDQGEELELDADSDLKKDSVEAEARYDSAPVTEEAPVPEDDLDKDSDFEFEFDLGEDEGETNDIEDAIEVEAEEAPAQSEEPDLKDFDTDDEGFDTDGEGFDTDDEGFDTDDEGFDLSEDFDLSIDDEVLDESLEDEDLEIEEDLDESLILGTTEPKQDDPDDDFVEMELEIDENNFEDDDFENDDFEDADYEDDDKYEIEELGEEDKEYEDDDIIDEVFEGKDSTSTEKPKKSAKTIGKPVKILLILFILLGIVYGAFTVTGGFTKGFDLSKINFSIFKNFGNFSKMDQIPVWATINNQSLNGRYVNNEETGQLFVITGEIINASSIPLNHIQVEGILISKGGAVAKKKRVFCGNKVPEGQLSTQNISTINRILQRKDGEHGSNLKIKTNESIPFMIVFSNLPKELENYTVTVVEVNRMPKK